MATIPLQTRTDSLIPDRLYFKIGDVATICGVAPSVLRFWESQFPQLKVNKSGTGQRLYRRRDVELALEIKRLVHEEGFTLAGARQALSAKPIVKSSAASPRSGLRLHRRVIEQETAQNVLQANLPVAADDATRLRVASAVVNQARNELRLILNQLSQPVQRDAVRAQVVEFSRPVQMGLF